LQKTQGTSFFHNQRRKKRPTEKSKKKQGKEVWLFRSKIIIQIRFLLTGVIKALIYKKKPLAYDFTGA